MRNDVWSHRQLLKVVSHTPNRMREASGCPGARRVARRRADAHPLFRESLHLVELPRRRLDGRRRGRRLDHIWVSPALKDAVNDFRILRDARGWERPSDHVPVTVTLEV